MKKKKKSGQVRYSTFNKKDSMSNKIEFSPYFEKGHNGVHIQGAHLQNFI